MNKSVTYHVHHCGEVLFPSRTPRCLKTRLTKPSFSFDYILDLLQVDPSTR